MRMWPPRSSAGCTQIIGGSSPRLQSSECVLYPQCPQPGLFSRTQPWESNVLLRPSGLNVFLSPLRSLYKIWRLQPASARFYFSCGCSRHTWYVIPLVIKPATYQSGVIWLFLPFLLALVCGCQFQSGIHEILNQQLLSLCIYCIHMHSDGEEPMRE